MMKSSMPNTAEIYEPESPVEEALANFTALLGDAGFEVELETLGIGRFQFLARRQMLLELKGLYIALWRLALARSFPNDADAMFASFLHGFIMTRNDKSTRLIAERAREYWGMILPTGDSDFMKVATHLVSFVANPKKDRKAMILKMALQIRSAYCFLFDRLI